MVETSAAEAPARRLSVLIVEDERVVAMDLQQTLRRLGYDPYAIASSAEDAIARATERAPDVALMDIRIKGEMDGIAAARALRERFGVAVVFLTALADAATLDRAKEIEPIGYLLKPVRSAELRSTIEVGYLRHLADARLRERERWITTILRSVSEAVVAVDAHSRVAFINPAALSVAGLSEADAIGRPSAEVLSLLDDDGRAMTPTPLDEALRTGRPRSHPVAGLRTPDGERRIVAAQAAPVLDDGRLLGAVVTVRDLTEQRRAEQQLELSDRLASLGTMAAGVAHELNNPLAVVLGNAGFVLESLRAMRDGGADDDAAQAVEEILVAARRMGTIIGDLRVLARPPERAERRTDARRAVEWALRVAAPELRYRAEVRCELGAPPPVDLGETRLGQVLVNLLVNAAQAIAPGCVAANVVTVRAYASAVGDAVFEVSDTGPGISAAVRRRMFEPFFTTKPVGAGTGLGLFICHGIVTTAGGAIVAEDRAGGGTTFRVTLPASAEPAAGPGAPVTTDVADLARDAPRPRVLVIDDDPQVLRTHVRVLQDRYAVTSLPGAREALAKIRAGDRYDVVLCDLTMPDLDGIEFHTILTAEAPEIARRVIFMTGGARGPRAEAFLETSTNECLRKPTSIADLRDAVARGVTATTRP